MVVEQGDVVWVKLPPATDSAPSGQRPAVVIQHDRFNRSRLNTAVVVAITSNLKYAGLPGNVRLPKGEAGLPKPSVVNVTQIATIDRANVLGKIGRLSKRRLQAIRNGLLLVLAPDEALAALPITLSRQPTQE